MTERADATGARCRADVVIGILLGRIEQADVAITKLLGLSSQLLPDERTALQQAWHSVCEVQDAIRKRAGL